MIILSNIHSKNICVAGGVSRTTCLSFMFQYVFVSLEIFGFYLLELKEMFRLLSGNLKFCGTLIRCRGFNYIFLFIWGQKWNKFDPVRTSCFRRAELNSGIKFIDLKLLCSSMIYFHSFIVFACFSFYTAILLKPEWSNSSFSNCKQATWKL